MHGKPDRLVDALHRVRTHGARRAGMLDESAHRRRLGALERAAGQTTSPVPTFTPVNELPACDRETYGRGYLLVNEAAADGLYVCRLNASRTYAWVLVTVT